MQKKRKVPFFFIMIVAIIFIVMSMADHKRLPVDTDWVSISIASNLINRKTFSDGYNFNWSEMKIASNVLENKRLSNSHNIDMPGFNHPPGYPFFIATIGWLTPSALKEFQCYITRLHECPENRISDIIMIVQTIIAIMVLILVFLLARELSSRSEIAVLVTLLVLFTGRLSEHSQLLQPYVIITALMLAFCYCTLLSYKNKSIILALVSGVLIGLAVLFRPPLWLVPILISPLPILLLRSQRGHAVLLTISLLIGYFIMLMPWLFRNYELFGEWALTHGESYTNLARRVAYNQMSFAEWCSAFIVWMPGPGESLSHLFVQSDIQDRLGSINQFNSIIRGAGEIVKPLSEIGDPSSIYVKILNNYVFNDFANYLSSMVPLLIRGIWGSGNLIGLFGLVFLWPLHRRLIATKNYASFLLIFGIMLACQLSQTMLSPNLPYYNGFFLFIHAYAIAYVSGGLELFPIVRRWLFKMK